MVVAFQASHSAGMEESTGSLQDVISSRDQVRLEQVLYRSEPYQTLQEAYYIAKAVKGLGITAANRKVCGEGCKKWALIRMYRLYA